MRQKGAQRRRKPRASIIWQKDSRKTAAAA